MSKEQKQDLSSACFEYQYQVWHLKILTADILNILKIFCQDWKWFMSNMD